MANGGKPMNDAERAGTLIAIVNTLGPIITQAELHHIKSRIFKLADLDEIPGPTLQEVTIAAREREMAEAMEAFNEEEEPQGPPKLTVIEGGKTGDDTPEESA